MPYTRDLPDVSGGFWPMSVEDIPTPILCIVFVANIFAIHLLFGYSFWWSYLLAFLPLGIEITLTLGVINSMRARRTRRNDTNARAA